jgi:hypothetical protein
MCFVLYLCLFEFVDAFFTLNGVHKSKLIVHVTLLVSGLPTCVCTLQIGADTSTCPIGRNDYISIFLFPC